MSFRSLVGKVRQAEDALEARQRQGAADWRQFKASWQAAWTPGRIVIAGLVSGFLVGRTQPLKHVSGAGAVQLVSALSRLLAGDAAEDGPDPEAAATARTGPATSTASSTARGSASQA